MAYLRTFLRGFIYVFLTAANTVQIADRHWAGMTAFGGFISVLWWQNSSAARENYRGAGAIYGAGAACGTLCGAAVANWFGR